MNLYFSSCSEQAGASLLCFISPLISCRWTVRRPSASRPCQPWSWLSRSPSWITSFSEAFPTSECYPHSCRPLSGRNSRLRVDIIPKADVCAEVWVLILKWFPSTKCLLVPVYVGNIDLGTLGTLKMVTLVFLYVPRLPEVGNFSLLSYLCITGTSVRL